MFYHRSRRRRSFRAAPKKLGSGVTGALRLRPNAGHYLLAVLSAVVTLVKVVFN